MNPRKFDSEVAYDPDLGSVNSSLGSWIKIPIRSLKNWSFTSFIEEKKTIVQWCHENRISLEAIEPYRAIDLPLEEWKVCISGSEEEIIAFVLAWK